MSQTAEHSSSRQRSNTYILNEHRRAALAEIDKANFSWFHFKICIVTGIGFFTDAYDIFAINIASNMLGYVYNSSGALDAHQDLGIKVATPVGTFVGQILFGWLADLVGRKRMYGIELIIMIVSTYAQAVSGNGPAVNIIVVLIVWRFFMGCGVGGDYPLSAVISSEFASTRIRGRMMTAVFANQGWGTFAAALVAFIITVAYKNSLLSSPTPNLDEIDAMWRLLIGLGSVPAAVALYFRLTIPETPRFTMDIERNVQQASAEIENILTGKSETQDYSDIIAQYAQAPVASWSDFTSYFSQWENLKILIGTSYSWFALDIAFYGLGLNSTIILQTIGFASVDVSTGNGIYNNLKNISIGNLILTAVGSVPGYWACFLFIDSWGRKPIQLMGFILLTILFIIMGFSFDALRKTPAGTKAFVFLYCLANFFQNFGPNTVTFILPGEAFPTRYRSTAHGMAAASGKLGAIIAQVGFTLLKDIGGKDQFIKHILQIMAVFMLTGIFSTLLIPETKNKSLEELSNEDQDGFIRE